jgi:hypothetical protein
LLKGRLQTISSVMNKTPIFWIAFGLNVAAAGQSFANQAKDVTSGGTSALEQSDVERTMMSDTGIEASARVVRWTAFEMRGAIVDSGPRDT